MEVWEREGEGVGEGRWRCGVREGVGRGRWRCGEGK